MKRIMLIMWILAMLIGSGFLLLGPPVAAKTLFEDDFSSGKLDKYAISWWDKAANPPVNKPPLVKIKSSNPPIHGPNVLLMPELPHVGDLLVLIKGLVIKDGMVQVLWADVELPEDTDGPFFVRGQLGKGGDPNDPKLDPQPIFDNSYLIELDTDTGLHVTIRTAGNENIPDPFKLPAKKSTGDWTWVKIQMEGPKLKLKSWPAKDKESAKWDIEVEDKTWESGMVGFRSWSGTAEIAYIVVSDLAGPSSDPQAVEPNGKLATTWSELKQPR